eukprot:135159-Rhodomonas_salina.3
MHSMVGTKLPRPRIGPVCTITLLAVFLVGAYPGQSRASIPLQRRADHSTVGYKGEQQATTMEQAAVHHEGDQVLYNGDKALYKDEQPEARSIKASRHSTKAVRQYYLFAVTAHRSVRFVIISLKAYGPR